MSNEQELSPDIKALGEKFHELRLSGDTLTIPEEIATWLGHAMLLYGVPFNYLVPDEAMLPMESIRFFSLDPGWLKCLLEGASSVGRKSTVDEVLDEYLRDSFLALAGKQATQLRDGVEVELNWPLTGFLLRSLIVEGWQGLEMTAKGEDAQGNQIEPLQTLRMDRLGPDIMLVIFNGKVTDVEIKQPAEGLHFGASSENQTGTYQKTCLRYCKPAAQAGDQIPEIFNIDVPIRQGAERVIDIKELASGMKDALVEAGAMKQAEPFTSAEFSLQMVDSPGKAIFKSTLMDDVNKR
jgi:hypothetical protein